MLYEQNVYDCQRKQILKNSVKKQYEQYKAQRSQSSEQMSKEISLQKRHAQDQFEAHKNYENAKAAHLRS